MNDCSCIMSMYEYMKVLKNKYIHVHYVSYYNAAYFAGEFEDLFCELKHEFNHVGTGRSAR